MRSLGQPTQAFVIWNGKAGYKYLQWTKQIPVKKWKHFWDTLATQLSYAKIHIKGGAISCMQNMKLLEGTQHTLTPLTISCSTCQGSEVQEKGRFQDLQDLGQCVDPKR